MENVDEEDVFSTFIYPSSEEFATRDYQLNIVSRALLKNTLVVLPTGLGKTFVAAVVMYNYLRWFPTKKVLFLAPTRPLVKQQIEACHEVVGINEIETSEMNGNTSAAKRALLWQTKRVFYCTPQTLEKDLENGTMPAEEISLLVIDEAHRAVGKYAFAVVVQLISAHNKKFRILALSATPGRDLQKVQEVCSNLLITHIEYKSEADFDVKPYVFQKLLHIEQCDMNLESLDVISDFNAIVDIPLSRIRKSSLYSNLPLASDLTKFAAVSQMDKVAHLQCSPQQASYLRGEWGLLSSLLHIKELFRHGLSTAQNYMIHSFSTEKGFGPKMALLRDARYLAFLNKLKGAVESGKGSPKIDKLNQIVSDHFSRFQEANKRTSVIVFAQYRNSVSEICSAMKYALPHLRISPFVGQAKKKKTPSVKEQVRGEEDQDDDNDNDDEGKNDGNEQESVAFLGQSQAAQQEVVRKFRAGHIDVLVATCIGEEGLDIGSVDLIVSFDALASPVRMIQRFGRAGRKRAGQAIVLVANEKEKQTFLTGTKSSASMHRLLREQVQKIRLFVPLADSWMFPRETFKPRIQFAKLDIEDFQSQMVGGAKTRKSTATTTTTSKNLSKEELEFLGLALPWMKPFPMTTHTNSLLTETEQVNQWRFLAPTHCVGHSSRSKLVQHVVKTIVALKPTSNNTPAESQEEDDSFLHRSIFDHQESVLLRESSVVLEKQEYKEEEEKVSLSGIPEPPLDWDSESETSTCDSHAQSVIPPVVYSPSPFKRKQVGPNINNNNATPNSAPTSPVLYKNKSSWAHTPLSHVESNASETPPLRKRRRRSLQSAAAAASFLDQEAECEDNNNDDDDDEEEDLDQNLEGFIDDSTPVVVRKPRGMGSSLPFVDSPLGNLRLFQKSSRVQQHYGERDGVIQRTLRGMSMRGQERDDEDDDNDDQEEISCSACGGFDSCEGNEIILCDVCNAGIHLLCAGLSKVPEGDYVCCIEGYTGSSSFEESSSSPVPLLPRRAPPFHVLSTPIQPPPPSPLVHLAPTPIQHLQTTTAAPPGPVAVAVNQDMKQQIEAKRLQALERLQQMKRTVPSSATAVSPPVSVPFTAPVPATAPVPFTTPVPATAAARVQPSKLPVLLVANTHATNMVLFRQLASRFDVQVCPLPLFGADAILSPLVSVRILSTEADILSCETWMNDILSRTEQVVLIWNHPHTPVWESANKAVRTAYYHVQSWPGVHFFHVKNSEDLGTVLSKFVWEANRTTTGLDNSRWRHVMWTSRNVLEFLSSIRASNCLIALALVLHFPGDGLGSVLGRKISVEVLCTTVVPGLSRVQANKLVSFLLRIWNRESYLRVSDKMCKTLNKYSGIVCSNVFAVDNVLRLVGSSISLLNMYQPSSSSELLTLFASKISDTRFVTRFVFGVPSTLGDVLSQMPMDMSASLDVWLGRIMSLTMVVYYPLEHGWYLSTLKPIERIDGGKWSLWSCRMWLIYVVCDYWATVRKFQTLQKQQEQAKGAELEPILKQRQLVLIQLTCIVADFIISLQYSVASGAVFSDKLVTWAIWYGGLGGLYKRWLSAASN